MNQKRKITDFIKFYHIINNRHQEKIVQEVPDIENCVVAEPQEIYGAELFEQYQREHGAEQVFKAAGQMERRKWKRVDRKYHV